MVRPRLAGARARRAPLAKTERRDPANRPQTSPLLAVERAYRDAVQRAREGTANTADRQLIRQGLAQGNLPRIVAGFDLADYVDRFEAETFAPVEEEAERSGLRTAALIGGAVGAKVAWDQRVSRIQEWAGREQQQTAQAAGVAAQEGLAEALRRYQQASIRPSDEVAAEVLIETVGLGGRDAGAAMQRLTSLFADAETDADRDRAQRLAVAHARRLATYAAERDARTKIMQASNLGREQAIAQAIEDGLLPANARKVWRAEDDACDVCDELRGEQAPWDGTFSNGRERPPEHPNCRCWIEPVVDDADE